MGQYCDLYIGNYSIHSTKNYVETHLITTFFRSTDLVEKKREISERIDSESFENRKGVENAYYYQLTVKELAERLD